MAPDERKREETKILSNAYIYSKLHVLNTQVNGNTDLCSMKMFLGSYGF